MNLIRERFMYFHKDKYLKIAFRHSLYGIENKPDRSAVVFVNRTIYDRKNIKNSRYHAQLPPLIKE